MRDVLAVIEERLPDATAKGLAQAVTFSIRDGKLVSGDKLPPIRTVATQLCLSPTTVSAAWSMLVRSGSIRTDGRRGSTVATAPDAGAARYRRALLTQSAFELDLSNGIPDPGLLPDLAAALAGVTSTASPGGYLAEQVLPGLAEALRADWPYPAEAFTVVDGAMDAVELVTRQTVRHGDRVVVEDPTFPPILDLIQALGAQIVGVPLDSEGMLPTPLSAALERPVSLVVLQPRGQNPTGASLSPRRAKALSRLIGRAGALVMEDDAAGSVALSESTSLGMFIPNAVVHARSFSKSHGADLRLAAVSGTTELIGQIEARRQLGQGWTSRILQRILLNFLTSPAATARVEGARAEYARRGALLRAGLRERGVPVDDGDGINLWVPVIDESAAIMRLAAQGIAVTPGTPFSTGRSRHIRVSIGLLRSDIEAVADLLAQAAHTGGWGSTVRH